MTMKINRALSATAVAALLALSATACSSQDTEGAVSEATSKAGDVVESATAKAGEAANEATTKAAEAAASASARMGEIKNGVEAGEDVKIGDAETAGDRTSAEITVKNSTDEQASYAVTVNFRDQAGDLKDTTVVTVEDVPAGQSKTGTARSNRSLPDNATAEVGKALRH